MILCKSRERAFEGLEFSKQVLDKLLIVLDEEDVTSFDKGPEWLLSLFDNLHPLVEEKGKKISGTMVETLTSFQKKILSILQLPEKIYELSFKLTQDEIGIQK